MGLDPVAKPSCPYCGLRLSWERCEGDMDYYRCMLCGPLVVPPDGRIRRVLPETRGRPS